VRVAYISLFRSGYGGGEGQLAHELARQFAQRHDVLLICPHARTLNYVADGGLQILGIQSAGEGNIAVPVLSKANLTSFLDCLSDFQPEIVHAHEPVSLALVGQIWAKSNGVPFVYTAHVLASRFMDFGVMDVFQGIRSSLTESVTQQFLGSFYAGCDAWAGAGRPACVWLSRPDPDDTQWQGPGPLPGLSDCRPPGTAEAAVVRWVRQRA
jgi:hypothetical protein